MFCFYISKFEWGDQWNLLRMCEVHHLLESKQPVDYSIPGNHLGHQVFIMISIDSIPL